MTDEALEHLRAGAAKARAIRAAKHAPCPHGEGAYHDCSYVDERNRLIARAEANVSLAEGPRSLNYSAVFMAEMDALALDAGLVKPPGPWLAAQCRAEEARRAGRRAA